MKTKGGREEGDGELNKDEPLSFKNDTISSI